MRTTFHGALHAVGSVALIAAMAAVFAASASAAGYVPGTFTPVTGPPTGGVVDAWPWNINVRGDILGQYYNSNANYQTDGFVDQHGHYTTINYPGEPADNPHGTNVMQLTSTGEIIGGYYNQNNTAVVYIDRNGRFTTLDDPNAFDGPNMGTWPYSANFSGEIVGWYYDTTSAHAMHGFIYDRGQWRTVDCPGAGTGSGQGTQFAYVSDSGVALGFCFGPLGSYYTFLYTHNHEFITIPQLSGPGTVPDTTNPGFVNDSGLIGGYYAVTDPNQATDGCVYNDGELWNGYVDRHGQITTIPVQSPTVPFLQNACGVNIFGGNDSGAIGGYYWTNQYDGVHGFVLTPSH
jgi:hypothetical protein